MVASRKFRSYGSASSPSSPQSIFKIDDQWSDPSSEADVDEASPLILPSISDSPKSLRDLKPSRLGRVVQAISGTNILRKEEIETRPVTVVITNMGSGGDVFHLHLPDPLKGH